jgi:hypothetical protein
LVIFHSDWFFGIEGFECSTPLVVPPLIEPACHRTLQAVDLGFQSGVSGDLPPPPQPILQAYFILNAGISAVHGGEGLNTRHYPFTLCKETPTTYSTGGLEGPEPVAHYGEEKCFLPLSKIELRIPVRLTRSLVTRLSLRLIACGVTHLLCSSFVASSATQWVHL